MNWKLCRLCSSILGVRKRFWVGGKFTICPVCDGELYEKQAKATDVLQKGSNERIQRE